METINRHHHRRLGLGTAFAALAALTLGLGAQACSSNDAAPGFKAGTYAIGLFIDDDPAVTAADFNNFPDHIATGTIDVAEDGTIDGSVFISYSYVPGDVGDNTAADVTGTVDADGGATMDIGDGLLTLSGTFYVNADGAAGMQGSIENDDGDFGDAVAVLAPGTGDIDFVCGHMYWSTDTRPASVYDSGYAPMFIAVQDGVIAGAASGPDIYLTFDGEVGDNLVADQYAVTYDFDAEIAAETYVPISVDAEAGKEIVTVSGTQNTGTPYIQMTDGHAVYLNAGFVDADETFYGWMNVNDDYCDYD